MISLVVAAVLLLIHALVCLVLFGSGSFLLPAMACILVLLLMLRKPMEGAEGTVTTPRKEGHRA